MHHMRRTLLKEFIYGKADIAPFQMGFGEGLKLNLLKNESVQYSTSTVVLDLFFLMPRTPTCAQNKLRFPIPNIYTCIHTKKTPRFNLALIGLNFNVRKKNFAHNFNPNKIPQTAFLAYPQG